MRKFLPILIVIILLVSMIGITTAFAGASISGSSTVSAGKSYTYTGKASFTGASLLGTLEGLGQESYVSVDASSTENRSISDSSTIKVKIPSNANPGDQYTIRLSGSYSYFDDEGAIKEKSFNASKTITVGTPSTPNPNATVRPLEGWEIVEEAVKDAEDGTIVLVEMKDGYKIPGELLKKLVDKKNILVIDFGTYKCTIDPAKLTDFEDMESLDLSLLFEKSAGLSEVAGELDLYQLHFGHSGELPGMLSFTFEATQNEPGDTVYLYYYYGEANVLEGKAMAVVDENGMVTFEVYHCSSYFVTGEIMPVAMSNFDTESADALEEMEVTLEESAASRSEMQTAFDESKTQVTDLEEEIAQAREEIAKLQEDLADSSVALADEKEAAAAYDPSSVSMIVFIASIIAVLLLSIMLTMMFCRAGLFRRTVEMQSAAQEQANIVNEQDTTMSRQQAKLDARDAKAREKQDAMDAKAQEKQDAMDAKAQEKQDAMDAKAQEKQDAMNAKAQEKQDAMDAKHRAKLDAMEAKQQAKDAKKKAKQDAKQDSDDETQI